MRLQTIHDILEARGWENTEVPHIVFRLQYSEFLQFKKDLDENYKLGLSTEKLDTTNIGFDFPHPVRREDLIARMILEVKDFEVLPQSFDELTDEEVQDMYIKLIQKVE